MAETDAPLNASKDYKKEGKKQEPVETGDSEAGFRETFQGLQHHRQGNKCSRERKKIKGKCMKQGGGKGGKGGRAEGEKKSIFVEVKPNMT